MFSLAVNLPLKVKPTVSTRGKDQGSKAITSLPLRLRSMCHRHLHGATPQGFRICH